MERARSEDGVFAKSQALSRESTGTLSLRRTRTWRFGGFVPGLLVPDCHKRQVCRSCGSIGNPEGFLEDSEGLIANSDRLYPADAILPSDALPDPVSQEPRRQRVKNKCPLNLSDLNGIKFAEGSRLVVFAWNTLLSLTRTGSGMDFFSVLPKLNYGNGFDTRCADGERR